MPGEGLTAGELAACCWAGRGAVLALDDGAGAACASLDDHGTGFVKLVAVRPDAQRRGHGRELLDAAHAWLAGEGATEVVAGASAPFYLWPGVDVAHVEALCLFEAAGYRATGAELNMRCPTSYRADPPQGTVVRRAAGPADAEGVLGLVGREWPWWEAEARRAIDQGGCHLASDPDGVVMGFGCHSVNRAGWIGPMGTDPRSRHGGVGAALLGALCGDLEGSGHRDAEIAWVGPVRFYAKSAGATVSRTFRSLRRRI